MAGRGYTPVKPKTDDDIITEKMKVLKELCVADKKNESEIEYQLRSAVKNNPDTDIDIVLARVAKTLIRQYYDK